MAPPVLWGGNAQAHRIKLKQKGPIAMIDGARQAKASAGQRLEACLQRRRG